MYTDAQPATSSDTDTAEKRLLHDNMIDMHMLAGMIA